MKWWKALTESFDPRALDRNAHRLQSLAYSVKKLRQEMGAVHEAVSNLARELRAVQMQTEQLIALSIGNMNVARVDGLEHVLDLARVADRVRAAIAQAELVEHPVAHLVVPDLLPPDLYRALVESIPADAVFEDHGGSLRELPVPPPLAPLHSIVTWTFIIDLVKKVVGPALIARFEEPITHFMTSSSFTSPGVPLTASRGRIVLRQPRDITPNERRRSTQVLTTVVHLGWPGQGHRCETVLRRRSDNGQPHMSTAASDSQVILAIPFMANSAVTFFNIGGELEYAPTQPAAMSSGQYTYEFGIAPRHRYR